MYKLKIFESAEFGQVRTVTIDGVPYFVGKDVASVLGYRDTSDALKSMLMTRTRWVGKSPTH